MSTRCADEGDGTRDLELAWYPLGEWFVAGAEWWPVQHGQA